VISEESPKFFWDFPISLLVDEPYGPAGLLFVDSFVDFRSVFLNGDESQPRPAPLRL